MKITVSYKTNLESLDSSTDKVLVRDVSREYLFKRFDYEYLLAVSNNVSFFEAKQVLLKIDIHIAPKITIQDWDEDYIAIDEDAMETYHSFDASANMQFLEYTIENPDTIRQQIINKLQNREAQTSFDKFDFDALSKLLTNIYLNISRLSTDQILLNVQVCLLILIYLNEFKPDFNKARRCVKLVHKIRHDHFHKLCIRAIGFDSSKTDVSFEDFGVVDTNRTTQRTPDQIEILGDKMIIFETAVTMDINRQISNKGDPDYNLPPKYQNEIKIATNLGYNVTYIPLIFDLRNKENMHVKEKMSGI